VRIRAAISHSYSVIVTVNKIRNKYKKEKELSFLVGGPPLTPEVSHNITMII